MIQSIVPHFRTHIEKPQNSKIVCGTTQFANPNPQAGHFPFSQIEMDVDLNDQRAVFCADICPEFIATQILTRGRPHFSLIHVAFVDDAIASSSFQCVTDQKYGEQYRYLELGVIVGFQQEAFFCNSIREIPRGAIAVDGYRVRWQCLPRKNGSAIIQRGILQVGILGIVDTEEIQIASVEVEYFRRRGVFNFK
ncbi:MAG: hypothetical protein WC289_06365 [Patescibacteria group bacterium]